MIDIVANVMLMMIGGALAAALTGWLIWELLRWTHHPAWGPPIAFIIIGFSLPTSDFKIMFLLFGALVSIGAFILQDGDELTVSERNPGRLLSNIKQSF